MLNILLPMSVPSSFFETPEYPFPKPLVEIFGKPMIQHVLENLASIKEEKRFIFVLSEEDCTRFHLDSTLRLLAGPSSIFIRLRQPTRGAACSALLAIEHIGNDEPLLIVNGDQIFDVDLNDYLAELNAMQADAGCITFNSVHPRWSYVLIENESDVVETAEKRPISRHAIAGFYYFKHGSDFVRAAQHSIRKEASIDGVFYIAPVLNEMVLLNRRVKALAVANESYHTFYSPKKIEEYEMRRA
ncbi:NTP transferase domain-containing protein [Pseudoduganella sp. FT25W]|uniref:NTP transferase domain-containing protein n=1 Tax=Duganella alba TaxID=2666081 RepID=A0A6L5QI66_9BURK|nr:glycosyltransferase family 2 protein [Duganella alba]MRX09504.1 NTP transferase domain-containing protein [Duganella alba]MRX17599.1 NTP transferase domain-containing protein [Duganella alba]